jgi:hypothetical protein
MDSLSFIGAAPPCESCGRDFGDFVARGYEFIRHSGGWLSNGRSKFGDTTLKLITSSRGDLLLALLLVIVRNRGGTKDLLPNAMLQPLPVAQLFLLFLLKLPGFGCGTLLRIVTVCGTEPWTIVFNFSLLEMEVLGNLGVANNVRVKIPLSPPTLRTGHWHQN